MQLECTHLAAYPELSVHLCSRATIKSEHFNSDMTIFFYSSPTPVRNVISGSPDRETDPIRVLIGGACRVWQWTPSHTAPQ
jgi:hypothetical protein